MAGNESGPEAGVKGVVEDVKGKAKEAVGAVTGKDELKREGEAQQKKADAQHDVAAKEAEAEKARGDSRSAGSRAAQSPELGGRGVHRSRNARRHLDHHPDHLLRASRVTTIPSQREEPGPSGRVPPRRIVERQITVRAGRRPLPLGR